MTALIWVYSLLGVVIGSFLNVCVDRLPDKKSIVSPPSHCPQCKQRLSIIELIPIISYIFLRGRCRSCGEKIPARVLMVELGTGVMFFLIWLRFGQSWDTALASIFGCLLLVIGFIDLEHQKIPNILIYPAIGVGLLLIPVMHLSTPWMFLIGGGLGFAVLFLITILSPGAMGMGDVKLTVFLGLILGYPEIVIALFLAFVSGGLIAGILLALKKIKRKDTVAFGPYLALAGIITILYGDQILSWWLRRMS
ncbi:MAG: prepilin peptidase [Anaerolineales bacterium]|nr:prepilin peptidase [Anaerolineales bacterium]